VSEVAGLPLGLDFRGKFLNRLIKFLLHFMFLPKMAGAGERESEYIPVPTLPRKDVDGKLFYQPPGKQNYQPIGKQKYQVNGKQNYHTNGR